MAYKLRSLTEIRNSPNPNDQDEIAYQQAEAETEASKVLQRYSKEPEFAMAVLMAAANQLVARRRTMIDTNETSIEDDDETTYS